MASAEVKHSATGETLTLLSFVTMVRRSIFASRPASHGAEAIPGRLRVVDRLAKFESRLAYCALRAVARDVRW